MRRTGLWIPMACVVALGQTASGTVVLQEVKDLTVRADRIVVGDVVEVTGFGDDDQVVTASRVVVHVDEYLLGGGAGTEVLEPAGGGVDDATLAVSAFPTFEVGDHVLLFLRDQGARLVDGYRGAYLTDGDAVVRMGPADQRIIRESPQPLDELLEAIEEALPDDTSLPDITLYRGDFVLPLGEPRFELCGYDWMGEPDPIRVTYQINPNCQDLLSAGDEASQCAEICRAMDAWNAAGAAFEFICSCGAQGGCEKNPNDGINCIYFDADPPGQESIVHDYVELDGDHIVDHDIAFRDGGYTWWNGSGCECDEMYDIRSFAAYALGRGLCLEPLPLTTFEYWDRTMFQIAYPIACETYRRTLHCDDIEGIIAIYGQSENFLCCNGVCDDGEDCESCPQDCPCDYCGAYSMYPSGGHISNVSLGAIDRSSGHGKYALYTCDVTTMEPGSAYTITVTASGASSADIAGLWIDWNQDRDFDDAGEEITASWSGEGPYTHEVTAPVEAAEGSTRMRVRIQNTSQDPTLSPCGPAILGETEDYAIAILLPACEHDDDCDDGKECTSDVCDPDDPLADSKGCVNSVLSDSCLISDTCYADEEPNPTNDCENCDADADPNAWTPLPTGTTCGDGSDTVCDNADTCDGSGNCEPRWEPPTTECRAASGLCDQAEYCTGSDAECPPDSFAPPTVECRVASDLCDEAEYCTGSDPACPSDGPKPPGTICHSSAGACDPAEECDGVSYECPPDELEPPGTECRESAGLCDEAEYCTGADAECPSDAFKPAVTLCRVSAGFCDEAEYCTGSDAECPPDSFAPPTVECRAASDLCDQAEYCTGSGAECPPDSFAPPTTECRVASDLCDQAEYCTGSDPACPSDGPKPPGTICHSSAGACDPAEECDGVSYECPPDELEPPGIECRESAGLCDEPEYCTGSDAECPPDGFKPPMTLCRGSAGFCDEAEYCTGSDATCPPDSFAPPTVECRTASDLCDQAEYCTGSGAECPPDSFAPPTTECRVTSDLCDQAEYCTGSEPTCPSDGPKPPGTICRPAAGACDPAEKCDGVSYECPPDELEPPGTECREPAGLCDEAEYCTGADAECPPDGFKPAMTLCRVSAGFCDEAEYCTGSDAACPQDSFAPPTTECRQAVDDCDEAEHCTGSGAECPPDSFAPATTECRAASDLCDEAEYCTGSDPACPSDGAKPAGTICRPAAGACDVAEECDGVSYECPQDEFEPAGIACGDPIDDDCTNPDTCDGYGNCLDNHEPIDAPCADDDNNECTANVCDGEGHCTHPKLEEGAPCTSDDDDCTDDVCDGEGVCTHAVRADGASCSDGNACNVGETCQGGSCTGGTGVDCSTSGDQCNRASCNPGGGEGNCSILTPKADGTPCSDDDPCTVGDTCQAGSCTSGDPPDCPDNDDPCTYLTCDPDGLGGNCDAVTPVADNTSCDDDLYCNGPETCLNGECKSGGNPCAAAGLACDERNDECRCNDDGDCDDGKACTEDSCAGGICANLVIHCADDDPCTNDSCVDGECVFAPVECPDDEECMDGQCVRMWVLTLSITPTPSGGAEIPPTPHEDGAEIRIPVPEPVYEAGAVFLRWEGDVPSGQENADPLVLIMDSDKTVTAHFQELDCVDDADCPEGAFCVDSTCRECRDDADCDDGLYCNGPESCVDGQCAEGEAPCDPVEACDEETDTCLTDGSGDAMCGAMGSGCGSSGPTVGLIFLGLVGFRFVGPGRSPHGRASRR